MNDATRREEDVDGILLAQIRETYGKVVYSHKIHEKQSDLCFRRHRLQRGWLVALTAVSSGTLLASVAGLFIEQQHAALVTSFIALLVTALNLGTKTFKYGEESQRHREAAARLWDVRESYLSLITDMMSHAVTVEDARGRRDELQELAREIYSDAPRTTSRAYELARDGLKDNEELTFSEQELDAFVPEHLRLGQAKGVN
jgi:hypothetical protein